MVSTGPSSLPTTLPMRRVRMATTGAVLIVLAASLVQVVRADRACSRLVPEVAAGRSPLLTQSPPAVQRSSGRVHEFTYAADETYLHLALARQMALVPPSAQTPWPAASVLAESGSPAWTALLAGIIRLTGGDARAEDPAAHGRIEWLSPLALNLGLAAMLIMLVSHMLRHDVHHTVGLLSRLLLVAVCMPIPLLVLNGGEYLAHAFVLLLAVYAGIDLIEREPLAARRLFSSMFWMALAVALRYESLAVVMGIILWAWIRRRLTRALPAAVGGLGFAIGLAIYLHTHGQPWLPLPIWARLFTGGGTSSWSVWAVEHAVANLREAMLPSALVVIAAVMLWSRREHQSSPDAEDRVRVGWLFVFLVAGATHLLIARAGGHFPYTAYLVPLGAVAILRALASRPGATWAPSAPVGLRYAVMAVFCVLPLVVATTPTAQALWTAPSASAEVYQRNRLTGDFVRTFFGADALVADETGALSYETNAQVLGLEALARAGGPGRLQHAQLWLRSGRPGAASAPPADWTLIGGWGQQGPAGPWSVEVYASPAATADAKLAAPIFGAALPKSIQRTGGFARALPEVEPAATTQAAGLTRTS